MAETVRVWVTRWAFSRGIVAVNAQLRHDNEVTYLDGGGWRYYDTLGRDAHLTREAAVADAEKRKARKIASLRKQIAKLEAMTFAEVSDGD